MAVTQSHTFPLPKRLLDYALGLWLREATLLKAREALRQAERQRRINLTEGTKGGRDREVDRWVPVSPAGNSRRWRPYSGLRLQIMLSRKKPPRGGKSAFLSGYDAPVRSLRVANLIEGASNPTYKTNLGLRRLHHIPISVPGGMSDQRHGDQRSRRYV